MKARPTKGPDGPSTPRHACFVENEKQDAVSLRHPVLARGASKVLKGVH